jgi:trk/ktr system potassium uptake protein
MRAIVVGAGGTARELLRRLSSLWELVLIDTDQAQIDLARAVRDVEVVVGDGSSALVLRRAGLEEADALVAATDDDDINLEAVRIAQEAGLLRVVGVTANPERVAEYRELGAEVFSPDSITARQVEVLLEPRRVASTTFAQGKAEAIEFRVSPDSPVAGKRLRELHSETWVVAAVLRDHRLIIPKGGTTLRAGDHVTVVGAAADFAAIVKTFTEGESRFPLNFGKKVAVVLDSHADLEGAVAEAISLVRNSSAEALTVVHRDLSQEADLAKVDEIEELLAKLDTRSEAVAIELRPAPGPLPNAVVELAGQESIGLIVTEAPEGGEWLGRRRVARKLATYGTAALPLLLARGRHPYSSIVVPARRTVAGESAGRAAIDLARTSGATLTGVSVVPPAFVGGGDAIEDARRSAAWLREEAAVQGVPVRRRVRRGNPIRVIEELAASASLVVLTLPDDAVTVLLPGIVGHLVRRVRSSVLLVPPRA